MNFLQDQLGSWIEQLPLFATENKDLDAEDYKLVRLAQLAKIAGPDKQIIMIDDSKLLQERFLNNKFPDKAFEIFSQSDLADIKIIQIVRDGSESEEVKSWESLLQY